MRAPQFHGCTLLAVSTLIPLMLVAACADTPAAPDAAPSAAGASIMRQARGSGNACVTNPTTVVGDEASLDAAVNAAQPGTVIAIRGTIAVQTSVMLFTPDVTLTCAALGDGLAWGGPGATGGLVFVLGNGDAIQGLALDATGGMWATETGITDGTRFQFNTVTCGNSCAIWSGTRNALVTDNVVIQPHSGGSGLHFQTTIDGTRIERNTITALVPTGNSTFGAIRPRDGTDVVVADNVISGPWSNGISAVNMNRSTFERNVITGPRQFGFVLNISVPALNVPSTGNSATANRVTDAGVAGFSLAHACFNVFHGNPSLGTTPTAFLLAVTTGGNVVDGTAGASVDHGALDCDGDGQPDPNRVSGTVSHVH